MCSLTCMSHEQESSSNPIAALNDAFRQQFDDWFLTQGAAALPDRMGLLWTIQEYDDFNENVDPHKEHDMGAFDWHNNRVWFKIDYYNQELRYWCDPLSEECRRVLTIMLASEY
jgi:uncharacterized protein DUF3768